LVTKYCLKEEATLFLAALFFFSGLLLLGQIMNLLRLVLHEGASVVNILSIVGLWFPTGISYAIPMSLLFAILIGYGQMAQQEELTAIRAAGVSPVQLLEPAMILGSLLTVALFLNEAWVAPRTRTIFREKLNDVRQDIRIENLISPGRLFTLGAIKFSCQDIEPGPTPEFKRIYFEFSGTPSFRILAQTAKVDRSGTDAAFVFEKGQIFWTEAEKHLSIQFESARHAIPRPELSTVERRAKDKGILDLIPWTALQTHEESFEFHKKAALILAPFFFAFFAATLSMLVKRGNRVLGFILTLAILAGYYILLAVAAAIRPTSQNLACLLVWSPNLILMMTGYFFYRLIFVL